ncbi:ABC-2 type transport system permease protein [Chitinophaga niastensis]|uniref:ABC-2 type transport system permease protein n=1 Tax=Chitinophaga niastensis TaxID=536980 RepID=A0A2P8HJM3_CHINA|nr:ABC transporter permease [Chitinophaga niastensis]PSL46422.1 ABC-2 type transport system permease protein [Chitinophaga niastensis]
MNGAKYSQLRAMLAITKGSLRGIFRSPSAVVFSLGFPLVFILVFGFIGGSSVSVKVGVDRHTDINSGFYKGLARSGTLKLITDQLTAEMEDDLKKGRLIAILNIVPRVGADNVPAYDVHIKTSTASDASKKVILMSVLKNVTAFLDDKAYQRPSVATFIPEEVPGREFKTIDFILPGQLGFALMSAAVFGTAFLFYNMRQTLVLKRFFATPIKRTYIVMAEAISRMIFQLISSVVIIALGHFAFGFTLVHGFATFLEMLVLSVFGLLVFMGFGFVVSSIAKNESTIPPLANIVTLPQFLLAGTFFPIDSFPGWLQPVCKIMPLTYLIDALRKVAFEGQHLWNVGWDIVILTIWGIVVYAVAVKVFKWE